VVQFVLAAAGMVSGLPVPVVPRSCTASVGAGFASMVSGLPVTLGGGLHSFRLFGSAGQGFLEQLLFAKRGEAGDMSVEALT